MDKLIIFAGKVAITVAYIEVAMLVHEWRKQAKLDTAAKLSIMGEDSLNDISDQLDDIKTRLAGLELG